MLITQPMLLGCSYDASLITNKYEVIVSMDDTIKNRLTSYPYIRFSVTHEAQVIIKVTRKEPISNTGNRLVEVSQIPSRLVISSAIAPVEGYGWEPICEVDGEQVFVDDEPVYGLQIVAEDQLIQFIPANAHIWGVLDLCTVDKL